MTPPEISPRIDEDWSTQGVIELVDEGFSLAEVAGEMCAEPPREEAEIIKAHIIRLAAEHKRLKSLLREFEGAVFGVLHPGYDIADMIKLAHRSRRFLAGVIP